jgi:hypothetical protein
MHHTATPDGRPLAASKPIDDGVAPPLGRVAHRVWFSEKDVALGTPLLRETIGVWRSRESGSCS